MNYRIGLDIGVASVGWCALESDQNGEPLRILDLGVRVFDGAENPKNGASLAEPRRQARGLRRRLRRRAHRLERVRSLCLKHFGQDVLKKAENNTDDIFRLRYIGLSQPLNAEELTRILIYFAKHRGFQSNRKSELNDNEAGKLLESLKLNSELMLKNGYNTIGEMIYRDGKFFDIVDGRRIYKTRNKDGDYSKTFSRSDLMHELELILSEQEKHNIINEDFKQKYLEIFSSQRSFDEGPAYPSPYRSEGYSVGCCTFEEQELRAPKSSYTFEYFNALIKINNLKIIEDSGERPLNEEEREKLYEIAATKKEYSFFQVKQLLSLPSRAAFNLLTYSAKSDGKGKTAEEIEKNTKLFKMHRSYALRAKLNDNNKTNIALIDKLAEILSNYKTDDRRIAKFAECEECEHLSTDEREKLLDLECSSFGNLSIKAMNKLIPFLRQGLKYDKACEAVGYNFKAHGSSLSKLKKLRGEEINTEINSIATPVVRRSVSQTLKVLNALIDKYGSPCAVNIELARELSKNFEERKKIERDNKTNEAEHQRALERLNKEFNVVSPKGIDVLKLRLYEEQGGKCAYSLKPIDASRLFVSNYVQIDHIIPYSRSFDDSFNNKVLVLTKENQDKGNKTPYEYLGDDAARWSAFEAFVLTQYSHFISIKKRKNLLCRSFSRDNERDWKERALNDTKYISRYLYNLINDYLYLQPLADKKKQVIAVNGKITAYLRKFWGLTKVREEGDKHHALDAAVIACVSDGIIHKNTKYNQIKERCGVWDSESKCYKFADGDGILLEESEYDDRNGYIAKPYSGFREELLFRLMESPQNYVNPHITLLRSLDYSNEDIVAIAPIFVSRMPNRKAHGPIHKETIRSARALEQGASARKVPLTSLKLNKDKSEIEGYDKKAKRDDRLLYEALFARLSEFDGDAQKAFSAPFYKPTNDGKQGNPVKKVWVTEPFNVGMKFGDGKSVADNGGMVRVDVFEKKGKYYCVPVYIKDIYAKRLPNRAITQNKKYDDWDIIDDSYEFLFALYPNDLVYIEAKKLFNLKSPFKENGQTVSTEKGFFYYKTINIATGAADIITHDNALRTSLGFKTLLKLQKYTVDILGEKHPVTKEKRLNTEWDI